MFLPAIGFEVDTSRFRRFDWSLAFQRRVTPMRIEIVLKRNELHL